MWGGFYTTPNTFWISRKPACAGNITARIMFWAAPSSTWNRRQIWWAFYDRSPEPGPQELADYLRAVEHAANAVANLSGPPLPERRFLLDFSARAAAIGREGLSAGLRGLLGGANVDKGTLQAWLPAWEATYDAASALSECPLQLHPHRRAYYRLAFAALLGSDEPLTCLWPLLHTWTQMVLHLPSDSPHRDAWGEACRRLELLGETFAQRVEALDAALDTVEELLEHWGQEHSA